MGTIILDEKEIKIDLKRFTGTTRYFPHPLFRNTHYTDGINFLISACEAWWLASDVIIYAVMELSNHPFIVVNLKVNQEDSTAVLTYEDGNSNVLHSVDIPYTDFPLSEIKLYFENNVLHLPSER